MEFIDRLFTGVVNAIWSIGLSLITLITHPRSGPRILRARAARTSDGVGPNTLLWCCFVPFSAEMDLNPYIPDSQPGFLDSLRLVAMGQFVQADLPYVLIKALLVATACTVIIDGYARCATRQFPRTAVAEIARLKFSLCLPSLCVSCLVWPGLYLAFCFGHPYFELKVAIFWLSLVLFWFVFLAIYGPPVRSRLFNRRRAADAIAIILTLNIGGSLLNLLRSQSTGGHEANFVQRQLSNRLLPTTDIFCTYGRGDFTADVIFNNPYPKPLVIHGFAAVQVIDLGGASGAPGIKPFGAAITSAGDAQPNEILLPAHASVAVRFRASNYATLPDGLERLDSQHQLDCQVTSPGFRAGVDWIHAVDQSRLQWSGQGPIFRH
jgi:hypothetical protein